MVVVEDLTGLNVGGCSTLEPSTYHWRIGSEDVVSDSSGVLDQQFSRGET